jgi:dihydrofolate reductase
MRRILVFNHLSLDGCFADAQGGLGWAHRDGGELERYVKRHRRGEACYLFGRRTFEMFASFWPTPAGQAASPYFAKVLNQSPKVVFSRSLKKTAWANTTLRPRADARSLRAFRASKGPDALIFGSGTLIRALAPLGLIDEYQLLVNPVALGAGKPLFGGLARPLGLTLLGAKAFKNGTVLLRYAGA